MPGRDRHVVVVEYHQQIEVQGTGVIQRLEGHTGRQGAIADHRDMFALLARSLGSHGHAEGGTDRGTRMTGTERIVFGFVAFQKTGQTVLLAQRRHAIAPTGQNLVWIGLMPDIPDQPIARRVEHIMQRHRQLDHAETGRKMPTGLRHRIHQAPPHLGCQGRQLGCRQRAQTTRRIDFVEQSVRGA